LFVFCFYQYFIEFNPLQSDHCLAGDSLRQRQVINDKAPALIQGISN